MNSISMPGDSASRGSPRGSRIFILSPARCDGRRASFVFSRSARFGLALELRTPGGAPLGEVFSFLSGLYFRGKLAYARAFASPPPGLPGVLVITPSAGLMPAEEPVTLARLRRFASVSIAPENLRYRRPLLRDARRLARLAPECGEGCRMILLGSVATGKYVDILHGVFSERLCFPEEFIGRGDMSRGSLMLRCVEAGRQLHYIPVAGAARHGPRPPRLEARQPLRPVGVEQAASRVPVGRQRADSDRSDRFLGARGGRVRERRRS